jgi:hypothetical protein
MVLLAAVGLLLPCEGPEKLFLKACAGRHAIGIYHA